MAAQRFSICVHGGAGSAWPDEDPKIATMGCVVAAMIGFEILVRGGRAIDAVEAAVISLEDAPQYNAGTGACLNRDGEVELDASIMDGTGPRAGAVAAVRTVKNPIVLARKVMEHTPHLLLAGAGADAFARTQGIAAVDPASLITARSRQRYAEKRQDPHSGGTVGAVACDRAGGFAAATSTGGTWLKIPGRVGDSPILGAGTWAQAGVGAVSCTGTGEGIILSGLARFAADQLAAGVATAEACRLAVVRLAAAGGNGGLILIDAHGNPAFAFDTERMARAALSSDGPLQVGYLREEGETGKPPGA